MTEIVSVNPTDFDATVRAGVTRHQLNDWIRADGLQFPIDPGKLIPIDACKAEVMMLCLIGSNLPDYQTLNTPCD